MDDPETRETVRLHRIFRTVHEMARDRGYIVDPLSVELSLEDFRRTTNAQNGGRVDRSNMAFVVKHQVDNTDLMVFFPSEEKVGIKEVKRYLETMAGQSVERAIIVYQSSITPSAQKALANLIGKYEIETFAESELIVNITHHTLVPRHTVLSKEEKQTLLQRYRLKDTQLPRIVPNDPIARYYGLKRGDVVKIVRPSETAGRYITYRICL
ncbi:DNA-directed RNA polymerases I [Gonapodya prolifera JEL478]|uniref:DNA-directed RNA polymerases I, II, and III subunit RPABC1 n=1 Tax=Gonapodya prolifera (strain JEL478) TaxID=1344416 RepID=A0A139ALA2_GONPJ|nr:DNA-directed RNA polymerases I [Gonapodya prolifera JEL478]|eukprot:KXS17567.1 DNA-directed RNA polymerases I [Gonapodya prolifera JEL478]